MKRFRHHLASSVNGLLASPCCPAPPWQRTGSPTATITLGMSAPFSGPNGIYGTEMKEGITAYFEQINKGGGINGRKLELVSLDDGYETDRAVANTKKLIHERKGLRPAGLLRLLAHHCRHGSVLRRQGTPSWAPSPAPKVLRNPVNRYMFHVRASYADETEAIVSHLASLGLKNIAVFYQNDGFGKSGLDGVTAATEEARPGPLRRRHRRAQFGGRGQGGGSHFQGHAPGRDHGHPVQAHRRVHPPDAQARPEPPVHEPSPRWAPTCW